MYKYLGLLLGWLLLWTTLQAQPLNNPRRAFNGGLVVGAVASQVDGDHHNGYHRFSPMGGFWVSRLFTDSYGLRFEFRYIGKGSLKNEGIGAERRKIYGLALHYIELPVLVEYHFLGRWTAGLGASGGYLLAAKEENQFGNLLVNGRKKFRPYEVAAHARIAFSFTARCTITLGASYSIVPIRGKIEGWDARNGQFNNLLTFGLDYTF